MGGDGFGFRSPPSGQAATPFGELVSNTASLTDRLQGGEQGLVIAESQRHVCTSQPAFAALHREGQSRARTDRVDTDLVADRCGAKYGLRR